MLFSTFASLLLQVVHEQRIKVNRRKVQLRECTAGYQAGDAFAGIREQNVRAVCTQAMRHLRSFDTVDGEDTALLHFAQEAGFFTKRSRYSNAQYDFINAFSQLCGGRIEIQFHLRLPLSLEDVRRIGASKEISLV
jgi:hypothetical protein